MPILTIKLFAAVMAMLFAISAHAQTEEPVFERYIGTSESEIRAELESMGYQVVEFEADGDEFEVEVARDGRRYEIEIDRNTGLVEEFEREH